MALPAVGASGKGQAKHAKGAYMAIQKANSTTKKSHARLSRKRIQACAGLVDLVAGLDDEVAVALANLVEAVFRSRM